MTEVTKQQGQQRSKGTDKHSVAEDTQKPELLHYRWGYKIVQPLWKTGCQFLKNTKQLHYVR